jgi:phosphatidylethanolamine/phosphatidyl-N-methylethanolamine N-methyltransferase
MSLLFFRRVLANPLRVGYVVPSSPFLTRQTARRIDFSQPRVVVELGPGEGCHTRQIVKRMDADSRLILFELDEEFVSHLRKQFSRDPRVTVLNTDALHLPETLREMGHPHCDYIVSGLPFFVIEPKTKDKLLRSIARAMDNQSRFITYQITTQLCDHDHLFELAGKEYCPLNFPPINVLEFRKASVS